ncbi:hypothetical protein U4960_01930 [Altererythrobacter sp. H2]|uniref:hypothetical protein n=1 Tax=Altererythrobacter sp. H2 TaxID=3108391 RepID=UPI000BD08648|nr:hypothetical protein [Altererythrobacter sp. H2]OZA93805.1 MAG: hypothetical protein B7X57_03770 [Erythrobacter sp. 34-65-8]WRK96114.1 hypothetical protein U4960_01930 [Altererythrobacter sp. H2]
MKFLMPFAALAVLAMPASAEEAPAPSKGEIKLAKMLEGRVAGEPERCINTFGSGNLQVIDGTALVYRQGKTLWVNRTRNPDSLDDNDYLVIRKYGSSGQLCKLDNVTTHDRTGNFFTGVVFLEDFVPYRKADG